MTTYRVVLPETATMEEELIALGDVFYAEMCDENQEYLTLV